MSKFYIDTKLFVKELSPFIRFRQWKRHQMRKIVDAKEYLRERNIPYEDSLVKKMRLMAERYQFSFDEFFYLHFQEKTIEESLTFISDSERIDFGSYLNKSYNRYIFDDKGETYKRFKPFYKRDLMPIYSATDSAIWGGADFLKEKGRVLIKPINDGCGRGLRLVDTMLLKDNAEQWIQLCKSYCKGNEGGMVIEEVLFNAPEVAAFHPSSLNTLRIPTVRFDERVDFFYPFMRFGQGGKVVDNGGAGGIICAVDVNTGSIVAAADERGNSYTRHPDSGKPLVGFTIPRWEEAKAFAAQLAHVVPSNRYTGWDLALTTKGWVMIEGNAHGQFLSQIPLQKGFRKEVNQIMRELHLKEFYA